MRKEYLLKRADLLQAVRRFFCERDFLEVDTPLLQHAIAPEAYIEPIQVGDLFLQTSPELYMKQLLAAGHERLFQICKCFRQGERGRIHLPEFTMLEWYRSNADYFDLMQDCEALFLYVDKAFQGQAEIIYNGHTVSLLAPWQRITVAEAFDKWALIDCQQAMAAGRFEEILVEYIEPNLGIKQPTFLYDYPAALGALARTKATDSTVAERVELYIGGLELANGFSELIDVCEQRLRFEQEREKIMAQGRDPGPLPEQFLKALPTMPESAGIALGVDRMLMLLLGTESIENVVPFV